MLAPQMQTTPRLVLTSALTLHIVHLMQQLLQSKHSIRFVLLRIRTFAPLSKAPHLHLLLHIACLSGALHGCLMLLLQLLPHDYQQQLHTQTQACLVNHPHLPPRIAEVVHVNDCAAHGVHQSLVCHAVRDCFCRLLVMQGTPVCACRQPQSKTSTSGNRCCSKVREPSERSSVETWNTALCNSCAAGKENLGSVSCV